MLGWLVGFSVYGGSVVIGWWVCVFFVFSLVFVFFVGLECFFGVSCIMFRVIVIVFVWVGRG